MLTTATSPVATTYLFLLHIMGGLLSCRGAALPTSELNSGITYWGIY